MSYCDFDFGDYPALRHIHELQHEILRRLAMSATQADLDNAITAVQTAVNDLGTQLTQAIADLEAKIAGSGSTIDFSPEVTSLQNIATGLANLSTQVKAADPGTTV